MERSWIDLTYEALVEIFQKLSFEDLYASVPLVCHAWRSASLDPVCWRLVNMEDCFQTRQESPAWWQPEFETKMDRMVTNVVDRSRGNLRELRTRHCSDSALCHLAARCPAIQFIAVKSCPGVTDFSACQIAVACSKLEQLDVSECEGITNRSLLQFGLHCKSLTVLRRNMPDEHCDVTRRTMIPEDYWKAHTPSNADEEAHTIANLLPNLKCLEMKYSKLTDQGLSKLVDGCAKLEYLNLFGCSNLSRRALNHAGENLKNLKQFLRPSFPVVNHLGVARYGHWQLYDDRFQSSFFQF